VPPALAFVACVAALLGAEIGERLPSKHEAGLWFWTPVAGLNFMGGTFMLGGIAASLGQFASQGMRGFLILLVFIMAPPLSGCIAQLGCPLPVDSAMRRSALFLSGSSIIMLLADKGTSEVTKLVIASCAIFMTTGMFCGYASLGARLAYRKGWQAQKPEVEIPHARNIS
jgi:hypothetical protein